MRKPSWHCYYRSVALAGVALAVLACEPPSQSTLVPVTLQQDPAHHAASGGASSENGPAPSLAYAPPPYPYATHGFTSATFAFFRGMAVSLKPSNVGAPVVSCAISPSLPAGLSLSQSDCSITGTPAADSTVQVYVVTAKSSTGSSQALVNLSVNPPAKVINLPQAGFIFGVGSPVSPTATELGGGALGSDCTSYGSLPPGVSLGANCTLQGTPSGATTAAYILGAAAGEIALAGFAVPPGGTPAYPFGQYVEIPVTTLTAAQPYITFGGQTFGQATLSAGSAMLPIVPASSGAAITACSVSPSLPAGLSLSQSDCSVSGTPSAASAPTTYVITAHSGGLLGNSLALTLAVLPAAPRSMACQSGTLCVHPQMPLWSQADPALVTYVNSQGYSVVSDPGWCAGVSSAMLLKAYSLELQQYSNYQASGLPAAFTGANDEYSFIYQSMVLVGTDIQNGGTAMPSNGMNSFLKYCGKDIDYEAHYPTGFSVFENPSAYSHGMPMGWIGVTNPDSSGHALAVNGVEGSFFKIYDPWGAVYNATITHDATSSTITYVSGDTMNDVSYYGGGHDEIFDVQWIWNYVSVSGAPAPVSCQ